MKVLITEIKNRSEKIFLSAGLSQADAKIITDVLLETEMRGVFTHGFIRLEKYIDCIKRGGIKTDGNYRALFDSPSMATIDACGNLGIVISYKAMRLAMQKASQTGIGFVTVKGSHHFGAAGYYTSMCADNDMIGMAMSNGDVLIAATGSAEKTIGNNPFSYAYPANKYGKIVYDIAMSYVSDRKILQMEEEGQLLPEGWIIDKDGNPTTDPSEYMKGGTLLPFGGYKGYGLAMMVETMSAVTAGAAVTNDVHAWNTDPKTCGNVGHCFLAIDLKKIGNPEEYKERVDQMIDNIKSAKKAKGATEIYYPGEIEKNKMKGCLDSQTVEILDSTMMAIERVEKEYGLI